MRDMFSNERRALYQFGGFHELSSISEEEWRQGLRVRFEEDDCTVDEEALELMVAAGEGAPPLDDADRSAGSPCLGRGGHPPY